MSNDQIAALKEGVTIQYQVFELKDLIDPRGDIVSKLVATEVIGENPDQLEFSICETEEQAELVILQCLNIMKQHNKNKVFTIIKTYSNAE